MEFKAMTGAELVQTYNEMVQTADDLGWTDSVPKPVKRFSSHANGVRRCEELHEKIHWERTHDIETPIGVVESVTVSFPETESDMAARKMKTTQQKTVRAKRAANGSQDTLAAFTERFNALVPKANKLGIKWARHHTSMFESKNKGAAQLKRLEDAIQQAGR